MTLLPLEHLGKGQRLAAKLDVEPEAKVMQSDFRRQASLKAGKIVRSFASQAEGVEQFVVDGFNHLSQARQPAPPGFGPLLRAALMRSGDDFCPVALTPACMWLLSSKAFIREIDPLGFASHAEQRRRGPRPGGKKGFRQLLIMRDFPKQSQSR